VLIDGAYPMVTFDEAGRRKVRAQFRRLGPIMKVLAAFGRGARMPAGQAADVVIEMDTANGELAEDVKNLDCPAVYVRGSGGHSGGARQSDAHDARKLGRRFRLGRSLGLPPPGLILRSAHRS
jgi:hypothetical protein